MDHKALFPWSPGATWRVYTTDGYNLSDTIKREERQWSSGVEVSNNNVAIGQKISCSSTYNRSVTFCGSAKYQ